MISFDSFHVCLSDWTGTQIMYVGKVPYLLVVSRGLTSLDDDDDDDDAIRCSCPHKILVHQMGSQSPTYLPYLHVVSYLTLPFTDGMYVGEGSNIHHKASESAASLSLLFYLATIQ